MRHRTSAFLVLALVGLGVLIFVVWAYISWRSEMDKLVSEHRANSQALVEALGRTGLTEHGAEIENFIIMCPHATAADARKAFFAVVYGCPDAPVERQIAIANDACRSAVFLDDNDFEVFCKCCGLIGGLDPKRKPDDCSDAGILFFEKITKHTGQPPSDKVLRAVRKLVKSKKHPVDEALAMAIVLAEQGDDPDDLEAIASE